MMFFDWGSMARRFQTLHPWMIAGMVLLLGAGCTLVTSLSGFSGGAEDADAGGPVEGGAPEAAPRTDAAMQTKDGAPAPSTAAAVYRAAVMADQPIAYYRFGDQGSGAFLKDEVDQVYVAVTTGTRELGVPGIFADGSDTALRLTNGSIPIDSPAGNGTLDFPGVAPFTMELWVKPTALSGEFARNMDQTPAFTNKTGLTFGFYGDAHVRGERWIDGEIWMYAETPTHDSAQKIPTDRFHHIALVFSGTTMQVFVDGTTGEGGPTRPDPAGGMPLNSVPFVAGQNLNAVVDELAFYDKALTAVQVAKHIAAAQPK